MSGSNVGEMGMGGGINGKGKGKGKGVEGGGNGADDERVLVVDAFGVMDNEVLGRAWCANWGLSAVVADVGRTWYVVLTCSSSFSFFRLILSYFIPLLC